MKYILYSQSRFVRFNTSAKNWSNDISVVFIDYKEALLNKIKNNPDFSKELLTDIEQGRGMLTEKRTKDIWSTALNHPIDADYVFINIDHPKAVLDALTSMAIAKKIEFAAALNLYLENEFIIKEGKEFLKKHESDPAVSDEENLQIILRDEQKRLSIIKEIQKTVRVVSIKNEGAQDEVEKEIVRAIEVF